MSTNAQQGELRVSSLGVAIPGGGGPALAGAPNWAIVIAVSGADGSPRAGLQVGDFSATVLSDSAATVSARRVSLDGVREPLAGVYVLKLDRKVVDRLHGPFACVVDVRPAGERAGMPARAVVPLER